MKNILFFVITALVLCSCNKDSEQDWSGMEYFTFRITGKVTDYFGNPLKGISVSALGNETFTLSDGSYSLEGRGGTTLSVFVNFSDTDGSGNGGRFIGTSRNIGLDYKKGKHGPYLGLYGKAGVDAVLVSGLTPSVDPSIPLT